MPRSLDLDRLKQFEARPAPMPVPEQATPEPGRWPSREAVRDGQISIKAPLGTIERFRALCRDDRRTYADMLGMLMDRFEGRS